jgi:pimeloyl-ACP methyl ester carboxylesterase
LAHFGQIAILAGDKLSYVATAKALLYKPDQTAHLDKLGQAVPILYMAGENCFFAGAQEAMHQATPRSQRITLENEGHICWLQNPTYFAEQVRTFLD